MIELPTEIPDPQTLLLMAPEELGAKMLFLLRKRLDAGNLHQGMFHPQTLMSDLWHMNSAHQRYPKHVEDDVTRAFIEAWAWLEAQGLIVPAIGMNGANGFRVFSRRAKAFENIQEFAAYSVARMLPREALNEAIRESVWLAFMRGEYDVAVFLATKAVEVAVKQAVKDDAEFEKALGIDLMRRAFHAETGPLTDKDAPHAERQARLELFTGLIGSFKNPQSHRDVNLEDPVEAMEAIMLANHLLRVVSRRTKTRGS